MTYRGHVENGVVVLDEPAELPEGAIVRVALADEEAGPTLAERLRDGDFRARLRRDWEEDRAGWENRTGVREWSEIVISECDVRP